MINKTSIEKIEFTSYNYYKQPNIKYESLTTETCYYLKNIANNNKSRNIILDITNNIDDKL
jgi:hypothetical protein